MSVLNTILILARVPIEAEALEEHLKQNLSSSWEVLWTTHTHNLISLVQSKGITHLVAFPDDEGTFVALQTVGIALPDVHRLAILPPGPNDEMITEALAYAGDENTIRDHMGESVRIATFLAQRLERLQMLDR